MAIGKTNSQVIIGGGGGVSLDFLTLSTTAPSNTSKIWVNTSETPNEIVYDSAKNYPTTYVNLPTALTYCYCADIGDITYAFGGITSTGVSSLSGAIDKIMKMDCKNHSCSNIATTLPAKLVEVAAATVGTNIYLFGGQNNSSVVQNTIYRFDTTNETITTLETTLPVALYNIKAIPYNNFIYLFGGHNGSSTVNTIYKFNTTNNTIQTLQATLGAGLLHLGGELVGDKIYLFTASTSNRFSIFDVTNDTITEYSLTNARNNIPASAVCGTDIYIIAQNNGRYVKIFDTISKTFTYNADVLQVYVNTYCCARYYKGSILIFADATASLTARGSSIYYFETNGGTDASSVWQTLPRVENGRLFLASSLNAGHVVNFSDNNISINIRIKHAYLGKGADTPSEEIQMLYYNNTLNQWMDV